MDKITQKGLPAPKVAAGNPSDTTKGAAALAVVKAKNGTPPEPESPLAARLRKVHEIHKLSQRRKSLVDGLDKVNHFDELVTGEDDTITLEKGREQLDITRPEAVKKVVDLLRRELGEQLADVERELLAVTI